MVGGVCEEPRMSISLYVFAGFVAMWCVLGGYRWSRIRRLRCECQQYRHRWVVAENPRYRCECAHCFMEIELFRRTYYQTACGISLLAGGLCALHWQTIKTY